MQLLRTTAGMILVLVIAACASTPPPGSSSSGATQSTQSATPTQALPQKLTIVVAAEPTTLDGMYEGSNPVFNTITQNMLETLARLDPATNQVAPWLATAWKQVAPTKWNITIRSGVKFHDGTTMTADDVAASINRCLDKGSTVQATFLAQWASAAKVDDSTVQITTSTVDPILPLQLQFASVSPASAIAKGKDFLATNVTGTGPFKLVKWDKGQSLTMQRFDGYWGSKATVQDVRIVFRSESSVRADMVRTGEAQVAQQLTAADIKDLKVASVPSLNVYQVVMNVAGQTKGSVMTDERVRKAVNHAIDRTALRDKIYGGQAGLVNGNVVSSSAVLGFASGLKDYPYDPAKAKALIAEAGAAGKPVRFVCSGGRFIADGEACQFITAQLNQVGLNVTMTNPAFAVWLDTYRAGPNGLDRPDLLFGNWTTDTYDLPSRTAAPWFRSRAAGGGGSTINDPKVDQLIASALAESDLAKRRALAEELTTYLHDHAYVAPLLAPNEVWGLAKNVEFNPLPSGNMYIATMRYTSN